MRSVSQDDGNKTPRCKYRGLLEHKHNFHLPYKYFGNRFMYICSRCLGLYGGLIIWLILFIFFPFIPRYLNSLIIFELFVLCFILTIPLVADWWLQCLAIRHSNNGIRLTTGLLTSLSGTIMIFSWQFYWISLPCSFLWILLVVKTGKRWKRKREPNWGCWACRGEQPKAKPLLEQGDRNIDKKQKSLC